MVSSFQHICSATGAAAGADYLDGDTYINVNYEYYRSHLWRYGPLLLSPSSKPTLIATETLVFSSHSWYSVSQSTFWQQSTSLPSDPRVKSCCSPEAGSLISTRSMTRNQVPTLESLARLLMMRRGAVMTFRPRFRNKLLSSIGIPSITISRSKMSHADYSMRSMDG